MSVTLGQILTSAYRRMGTQPSDPEYPREQMVLYANLALGELHGDCAGLAGGDVLLELGRVITKTGERQWAFAQQTPAITSVLQVRRVRRTSNDGATCDPVPAESLELVDGDCYALTGPDSAIVLRATRSLGNETTLAIDYTPGPPLLVENADTLPPWMPDQFRDVVELMMAEAALPQGSESRLSPAQLDKLTDRRAQLWTHWSSRSPGPTMRR